MTTELKKSEVVTMKCRVAEGEPQSEVALTINWDDAVAERAFAIRGVKIVAQAMVRASGAIPADLTVSVSELSKRERGGFAMKPTPENAKRMMSKLDDAQYAAALTSIGIPAGTVRQLVSTRKSNAAPAALVGTEAKRAARKPSVPVVTKPTK